MSLHVYLEYTRGGLMAVRKKTGLLQTFELTQSRRKFLKSRPQTDILFYFRKMAVNEKVFYRSVYGNHT